MPARAGVAEVGADATFRGAGFRIAGNSGVSPAGTIRPDFGNGELSQAGRETTGLSPDAEAGQPIRADTSVFATETPDPTP